MSQGLHPLLQRQLRRLGVDPALPAEIAKAMPLLLQHVSRAYADADQDRYLLEHSQEVASQEMGELYQRLQASKVQLASLLSLSTDWVWEQDSDLRFVYVSEHVNADGLPLDKLLQGQRMLHELRPLSATAEREMRGLLAARAPFRNFTCSLLQANGERLFIRVSGEPAFDGERFIGYRGVGSDVTQAARAEERVLQLASFDSLTGLVNRNTFMTRLDAALARASDSARPLVLFFIDLDRFKTINDSLGHDAGDELLKVMAARLQGLMREGDIVARLGGDEFVVMLDGIVDPAVLSKVADRMLNTLCEPLRLSDRPVQVSASIGISVFPADGNDAATLLKSADTAMYLAKTCGKNNFQFFTPQLAQRAAAHFALEADLREALPRGELRLHYQPKFDTASSVLVGMEALVRWQHPKRGLLSPGEFIELAEESGQILVLGRWVLEQACRQARAWRQEGLLPPRISVNLSVRQFVGDSLVQEVHDALAVSALESAALEVEITESLLMSDPEHAQNVLQRLHKIGVAIAIDDFGTGYSSLAYLKHFPAQTLKIDRSFVKGLPGDRGDAAITQAVVALAHSMDLLVVAEGVETSAQLNYLRTLGCDQVQGYLTGRPMPPEQMRLLLGAPARAAIED